MIGARIALDTSIAIAILNQDRRALARYHSEGPMVLSAVAAGELLFGAANSGLPAANLARYETFISSLILLPVDRDTAQCYANLRLALARAGTPIPENDLWIAATCLQHGLSLAARDEHFLRCPGLMVEDWTT